MNRQMIEKTVILVSVVVVIGVVIYEVLQAEASVTQPNPVVGTAGGHNAAGQPTYNGSTSYPNGTPVVTNQYSGQVQPPPPEGYYYNASGQLMPMVP